MAKLRLKYVNEYRDRTGTLRRYFRKGGKQFGALPGAVGSAEFMAAYSAYLAEQPQMAGKPLNPDSLQKLATDFYGDRMFTDRAPSTRKLYRYALDPLMREHGHRSVTLMTRDHVEKILEKIGAHAPGMHNLTLAVLRLLMKFAIRKKRRTDNPTSGIEPMKGGTHHTWTDAELRQFERRWPLGSRQRLAFSLLLYTGQRVGDVAAMKRADIQGGGISVVQQKTGAEVWIPIHPDLDKAMKACPAGLRLIGDQHGRPIKGPALSNLMRQAIKEAGLPGRCVSHGLRKAAMRRLAEIGATTKQIAAVSGHKTMKEVERYTEAAEQKKMAKAAIGKLHNGKGKTA